MSAEPGERWRRRLHDVLRVREALANGSDGAVRQQARLRRAARLRAATRERDASFGAELFADPAFDLLLDLYLVEHGVAVERSTPGASWRYIATMEDRGLVERARDDTDPRRATLRLSAEATEAMEHFLDRV